jgi:hypothetical protein
MKYKNRKGKGTEIHLPRLSLDRLESLPQRRLAYFSILLSILTIAVVFIAKGHLPPEVPLYYGLPISEEQMVPAIELTLPSIFAIALISLNILLALIINDKFLRHTLIVAGFAVSFFATVTTIKIVYLVGSF